MGKVIVKISELPVGYPDFEKVESRLGKRFLLKSIQTKINVQEFFFDDSYSEQVKDF